MKGRRPCIHGDLCREIYKLTGCIYSVRCPYGCKFYEPVKILKKGDVVGVTGLEPYLTCIDEKAGDKE